MSFHKFTKQEEKNNKTHGYLKQFGSLINYKSVQNKVRKFGSFLAGMIMPAIGVFIAWGLLTAFFLDTGWIPNKFMAQMIGPTLIYIIPSLVAFFGGKQIYGIRGGLIGVIATIGIIIGGQSQLFRTVARIFPDADGNLPGNAPMILGAMIAGPIAAWIFKTAEKLWTPKIPQGFEMLINNFSMGILGFLFAITTYWGLTPIIAGFQLGLTVIIKGINDAKLEWLLPIFVEPEKVLFLNNAVNHGIFTPLGLEQIATSPSRRSFLLLLDPNPGQGLGLLMAFYFFAKSADTRSQALSAAPIHFIGGIHEVYFPFVLMKPFTIVFMIIGGIFNVIIYQIFNVGSIAINSPGSVISVYTFIARDSYLGLTISVFGSAIIVFLLTSSYLIFERQKNGERVFYNPKYSWINGRYIKLQRALDLKAIDLKTPIRSVEYSVIKTKHQYKFEIVKFKDQTQMHYILSKKAHEIAQFKYVEFKNKTFLLKVFNVKSNKLNSWIFKFKTVIMPKKMNYFLKQLNLTALKNNQKILWSKVLEQEQINPITAINYSVQNYEKHKRTYSYFNQKNKLVTKTQAINFDTPKPSLQDLEIARKHQTKPVQNLSLNNNLIDALKKTKQIVFACEAGMGSSAMGASIVRRMLSENNIKNITVINKALKNLDGDDKFVITQENFKSYVNKNQPHIYVYTIKQFLNKEGYGKLINAAISVNTK